MMNRRKFLTLAALSLSAGVLAACGSEEGEGAGPIATVTPNPAKPPTATAISPEELAKVSSESGEYALTVVSIKDPITPRADYTEKEGTRLLGLELRFENLNAAEPMDVDPQYAQVTDIGDVTYIAEVGAIDNEIAVSSISKGEKATGWMAFAVPTDAKIKDITYRIGLISTVTLVAALPGN